MVGNKLRESNITQSETTQMLKNDIVYSEKYANYIIQYYGEYTPDLDVPPYVYITPIDKKFCYIIYKFRCD